MWSVAEELTVILVPYRDWEKRLGGDQIDQFFRKNCTKVLAEFVLNPPLKLL
jgi:hypothetical protein